MTIPAFITQHIVRAPAEIAAFIKDHSLTLEDIPDTAALHIYVNSNTGQDGFIVEQTDGKFSVIVENANEYGTLAACEALLIPWLISDIDQPLTLKYLNAASTRLFARLLIKSQGNSVTFYHSGSQPLQFSRMDQVLTPDGPATRFGLAHTHIEGFTLSKNPEVQFLVRFSPESPLTPTAVAAISLTEGEQSEQSAVIHEGQLIAVVALSQKDHHRFAVRWLDKLKRQGVIK